MQSTPGGQLPNFYFETIGASDGIKQQPTNGSICSEWDQGF